MTATKTKKLALLSVLTAVSLIMFLIEAQIPLPVPLPGVKPGLSNIITTCVLFLFGWKEAIAISLVRIVLGSVITGQLGSIVYSLCGAFLSLLGMILLRRVLQDRQFWVAGVIGGALHNVGQMIAAVLISRTPSLFVYLPVLLLCGMLAGLFTGLCAQFLLQRLKKSFYPEDKP